MYVEASYVVCITHCENVFSSITYRHIHIVKAIGYLKKKKKKKRKEKYIVLVKLHTGSSICL